MGCQSQVPARLRCPADECGSAPPGADLISDVLAFGRLRYGELNAVKQCNRLRQVLQSLPSRSDSRLRCSEKMMDMHGSNRENVHAMTNTGNALRQNAWWKWLVIGIIGGGRIGHGCRRRDSVQCSVRYKVCIGRLERSARDVLDKELRVRTCWLLVKYALQNNAGSDIQSRRARL